MVFHNLSGYDSHLFIKNHGVSECNINCISDNEEMYINFNKEIVVDTYTNNYGEQKYVKREIRFINNFKFIASGLDKFVSNLDKNSFQNTSKFYDGRQFNLLSRKGVCICMIFWIHLKD